MTSFDADTTKMVIGLLVPAVIGTIAGTYIGVTRTVRLWRSYRLKWPSHLHQVEQALICRRNFRRHGVRVAALPLGYVPYDLEIIAGRLHVFISFRDEDFGLTEAYLRDMRDAEQALRDDNRVFVVVSSRAWSRKLLNWARHYRVPLLYQEQVGNLRDLIKAKPKNFRDRLYEMSPAFAESPPMEETRAQPLAGKRPGN
jgi:hypothetical protein